MDLTFQGKESKFTRTRQGKPLVVHPCRWEAVHFAVLGYEVYSTVSRNGTINSEVQRGL